MSNLSAPLPSRRLEGHDDEPPRGVRVSGGTFTNSANSDQTLNVYVPHAVTIKESIRTPLEHPSRTYSRLLLSVGRGYPLWYPKLQISSISGVSPSAPASEGVRIGDVGIVRTDGSFDFLFNICQSANSPVNKYGVPQGFKPLRLTVEEEEMSKETSAGGEYAGAGSIKLLKVNTKEESFHFQSETGEGALLILPSEVYKEEIIYIGRFREYAGVNGEAWYRFANEQLRRDAYNGSIYLITGFEKTVFGGNATFKSHTSTFKLSFVHDKWTTFGLAQHNKWPFDNTPRHAHAPSSNPRLCVFLKGFKVTLGETLWDRLLGYTVKTKDVTRLGIDPMDLTNESALQPFTKSQGLNRILGILSWLLYPQGPIQDSSLSASERSRFEDVHPSYWINQYLLLKAPEAKVAITHDDDWRNLRNSMGKITPYSIQKLSSILSLVLEKESGIVHLDQAMTVALISAIQQNRPSAVDALLARPDVDVNQLDDNGVTPLIHAASYGRVECVRILLRRPGIDINQSDKRGRTALSAALEQQYSRERPGSNHLECTNLLLQQPNLDINTTDYARHRPLYYAELKRDHGQGWQQIYDLLKEKGARPDEENLLPNLFNERNGPTAAGERHFQMPANERPQARLDDEDHPVGRNSDEEASANRRREDESSANRRREYEANRRREDERFRASIGAMPDEEISWEIPYIARPQARATQSGSRISRPSRPGDENDSSDSSQRIEPGHM